MYSAKITFAILSVETSLSYLLHWLAEVIIKKVGGGGISPRSINSSSRCSDVLDFRETGRCHQHL